MPGSTRPRVVLFVCVHNAGRSQMAEAFFNYYTDHTAEARSGGTCPADTIHPEVQTVMSELGLDLSDRRPGRVPDAWWQEAERIIAMGCSVEGMCPASRRADVEDWGVPDPKGRPLEEVRRIRDQIHARVLALLNEMGIRPRASLQMQPGNIGEDR